MNRIGRDDIHASGIAVAVNTRSQFIPSKPVLGVAIGSRFAGGYGKSWRGLSAGWEVGVVVASVTSPSAAGVIAKEGLVPAVFLARTSNLYTVLGVRPSTSNMRTEGSVPVLLHEPNAVELFSA